MNRSDLWLCAISRHFVNEIAESCACFCEKSQENANLDLLEESDDEDEFENTHLDKFVDLEKTVLMECVF